MSQKEPNLQERLLNYMQFFIIFFPFGTSDFEFEDNFIPFWTLQDISLKKYIGKGLSIPIYYFDIVVPKTTKIKTVSV